MQDLLYSVPEVAKLLKVNKNTVYALIKKGYLKALKLGRLKITHAELMRFLEEFNGREVKV